TVRRLVEGAHRQARVHKSGSEAGRAGTGDGPVIEGEFVRLCQGSRPSDPGEDGNKRHSRSRCENTEAKGKAGMAQSTDGEDGNKTPAGPQPPAVQVRVAGQYIKDLSFENPNVRKLLDGPGEKPALRVEVNVNATKLTDKMFESAILFKAE